MAKETVITMAHGDGGELAHQLIQDIFIKAFSTDESPLMDGAVLSFPQGKLVTSTDSFVVKPIFFPGGNIGKLAVCGTINDLVVMGAKPLYLTCGFILEEGFEIKVLEDIVQSMAKTCCENGVTIVAGDTKVVERGSCDGIYINTTGIGVVEEVLRADKIQEEDVVIISGTIGDHGISILAARNELGLMTSVKSDCASLYPMTKSLEPYREQIRIMRDPTRGGLATTLVEICEDFHVTITLDEQRIPVRDEVNGACELFGFEPLYLANEGKMIVIVKASHSEVVLEALREHEEGRHATIIGKVSSIKKGQLQLKTVFGATRPLNRLSGVMLPRIC